MRVNNNNNFCNFILFLGISNETGNLNNCQTIGKLTFVIKHWQSKKHISFVLSFRRQRRMKVDTNDVIMWKRRWRRFEGDVAGDDKNHATSKTPKFKDVVQVSISNTLLDTSIPKS